MFSTLELVFIGALTLLTMIALGTSLTTADFRRAVTRPRGVSVGLVCQFGLMPALGYGLIVATGLEGAHAVGMLLIATTAGGTGSNLYSYFSRSDVALSVTMTAVSTVVAIAAQPALLAIYAGDFGTGEFATPYGAIAATLAGMLVPVGLGMLLRARDARLARRVERVGSIAGIIMIAGLIVLSVWRRIDYVMGATWAIAIACAGLAVAGITLGWAGARLLGLAPGERRAVSFETGFQSAPTVIAVITTSYPADQQAALLHVPLLYATGMHTLGAVMTVVLRRLSRDDAGERSRSASSSG